MSAFTDRLARFVRWFFNSSPTAVDIDPVPALPPIETPPLRAPSPRAGRDRVRRSPGDRSAASRDANGRRREPAKAGLPRQRPGRADA